MFAVCWRWELTPKELMASFECVPSSQAAHLTLDARPFPGPCLSLEGTEFTYQLALSTRSRSPEIQALAGHHPELSASGDERSGVLVYHGERCIASLTIPGKAAGYSFYVEPEYRNQHLAFRTLVEWCSQTKRIRVPTYQRLTLPSIRALLGAHKVVVARAVAAGKPVPERVTQAIAAGVEEAAILRLAGAG